MAKKVRDKAGETVRCPGSVLELVERFAEHIEAYKRGTYNETQARRECIDPLFTAPPTVQD